jgi:hypothetical protein
MGALTDGSREISLIPYLSKGKGAPPIGISLTSGLPGTPLLSSPFPVLNDSDPLTLLQGGAFVTDSGCELKRVFLLLQRDRYLLGKDELWPLTNGDVDAAWQKAFISHQENGDDPSRYFLQGQVGEGGAPIPFAPLFYCRSKRVFFHPPCPRCGLPLHLCRDDRLLAASALQPYSGSLKRYLHCDSCISRHPDDFYVRELSHDDPPAIRDFHGLINDYGRLRKGNPPAGSLPCSHCDECDGCFGDGGASHSTIVPFSFYPFHLLLYDAMSLPAVDFLQLISGRSIDDLGSSLASKNESARVECLNSVQDRGITGATLFPMDSGKFFLEVLYLKLSFLGDILGQISPKPENAESRDMSLTVDRIWVALPHESGLLPSFWNFRTKILDIVRPPDIPFFFAGPASSNLLLQTGLLWFYVLLANSVQSGRDILPPLKEAISGGGTETATVAPFSNAVFSPEQIFWEPQEKRVERRMFPLWEQSLAMGLDLLMSAKRSEPQWPFSEFFAAMDELRGQVRTAIFSDIPAADSAVQVDTSAENTVIRKQLTGIIDKWRNMEKKETLSESPLEENFMEEAVIFKPAASPPETPVQDAEEWTETVILSPMDAKTEPPSTPSADKDEDPLLETVVLASGYAKGIQTRTTERQDEDEAAVPETVILQRGVRPEEILVTNNDAPAGMAEEENLESADDDDIPETIILQTQKAKEKVKKWKD